MFRHVVLFKWSEEAGIQKREAAVRALREWAVLAAEFGTVTVATDAGLAEANYDVAVVADFPDVTAYQAYATADGHRRVVQEHLTPNLASRAAVQCEL